MSVNLDGKPGIVHLEPHVKVLPQRLFNSLQDKVIAVAKESMDVRKELNKLEKEWDGWPKDQRYRDAQTSISSKISLVERKLDHLYKTCKRIGKLGYADTNVTDLMIDLMDSKFNLIV